jgi:CrcB protein
VTPTLWVAVGSAIGGVARFWCVEAAAALFGATFPWGTLGVNIVGSLAVGVFFGAIAVGVIESPAAARQFFSVGFCGGFTTFSAFSLQTVELALTGAWGRAALYVIASVLLCVAATAAGWTAIVAFRP